MQNYIKAIKKFDQLDCSSMLGYYGSNDLSLHVPPMHEVIAPCEAKLLACSWIEKENGFEQFV